MINLLGVGFMFGLCKYDLYELVVEFLPVILLCYLLGLMLSSVSISSVLHLYHAASDN